MEDVEKKDEFENADLICGDCSGEFVQVEHNENKVRLFTFKKYVKWFYQCNRCGKQSKLFSSKIQR